MKLRPQGTPKWALVVCLLGGLAAFGLYRYNSQAWIKAAALYDVLHDPHQLKEILSSFGPYSPLVFILIQLSQVVVAPIPGGAVEFLGGYFFGIRAGLLYNMIGLLFGSWLAFSLARVFEKWVVERLVSPETLKKFDYLVGHEGVILSFLLFLMPCFPKDALCYILGLTPMHLGIFLVISTIGRIPGTLMATLQGAKAFDHQYVTFFVLSGISTLVILIFYVYRDEIHQLIKKVGYRKV